MHLEERRQGEVKTLRNRFSNRVAQIFGNRQAMYGKLYVKEKGKPMHPNAVCTVCGKFGINNQRKTCYHMACKN